MDTTTRIILGITFLAAVIMIVRILKNAASKKVTAEANRQAVPERMSEETRTASDGDKQNVALQNSVRLEEVIMDEAAVAELKEKYIAFDVETTGFSSANDRIIELGAVEFINGQPGRKFSSLVNAGINIPAAASAVNHITNDMLTSAPSEETIYRDFIEFLGDAINGEELMCAHNTEFDFSFLSSTLKRLGYTARLVYVDTLSYARRKVKGLSNYKQPTVADYFGIEVTETHRAAADAEVCGQILWHLMSYTAKKVRQDYISPYERHQRRVAAIIENAKEKGVDFTGIHFAFHGVLKNPAIERTNGLDKIVEALGGVFHDSVSGKVDYYVSFEETETATLAKAKKLAEDPRYHVQIIDTEAFLGLLGYEDREPNLRDPKEIRVRKADAKSIKAQKVTASATGTAKGRPILQMPHDA